MPTLYAMEFGLDIDKAVTVQGSKLDMEEGMACSDDDGSTWQRFDWHQAVPKGSRLKFFLYDASPERGTFSVTKAIVFTQKAAHAVENQGVVPWRAGSKGDRPGYGVGKDVPPFPDAATQSAGLGYAAPRVELRVGDGKGNYPEEFKVLEHEGRFLITLQVTVQQGQKQWTFRQDPELIVGGGGK